MSVFTPLSAHAFPFFPDHAHSINIVTINCRSVTNKLPELYAICHANKPTIICLTETWLSPSLLFSVPGYTCFCKDRSTHKNLRSNLRGYGGVAILILKYVMEHFHIAPVAMTLILPKARLYGLSLVHLQVSGTIRYSFAVITAPLHNPFLISPPFATYLPTRCVPWTSLYLMFFLPVTTMPTILTGGVVTPHRVLVRSYHTCSLALASSRLSISPPVSLRMEHCPVWTCLLRTAPSLYALLTMLPRLLHRIICKSLQR